MVFKFLFPSLLSLELLPSISSLTFYFYIVWFLTRAPILLSCSDSCCLRSLSSRIELSLRNGSFLPLLMWSSTRSALPVWRITFVCSLSPQCELLWLTGPASWRFTGAPSRCYNIISVFSRIPDASSSPLFWWGWLHAIPASTNSPFALTLVLRSMRGSFCSVLVCRSISVEKILSFTFFFFFLTSL